MDVRFIVRSTAFLAPLVLLFSIAWYFHAFVGDYAFHATYRGDASYPPVLAWILNALELAMPRALALFLVAVLVVAYLPYVLIFEITKKESAAWIYLYGSGIPIIVFFVWFIPQAIIHVFILASLRWRWFFLVFLALGWLVHVAWLYALILALAYSYLGGRHDS